MTTPSDLSDCYVPYARRRNTPAQLAALNKLFDATPHPTRAQRQTLANDIGMELKSVTNWFQNRRQISRKKSSGENKPHKRAKTPLDRPRISLDHIAALSERPSLTLRPNSPRSPLTPRKSNVQQTTTSELWTHMLSSPPVLPSIPDPEEARLTALSSRAKILYPLEWACLKARRNRWDDEDGEMPMSKRRQEVEDGTTDPLFSRPSMTPQLQDVEAAITLLGFKTRS